MGELHVPTKKVVNSKRRLPFFVSMCTSYSIKYLLTVLKLHITESSDGLMLARFNGWKFPLIYYKMHSLSKIVRFG